MSELFTISNPIVIPEKRTAIYHVIFIGLYWEQSFIVIHLRGENGETEEFSYGGIIPGRTQIDRDIAQQMMIGLNKANLSLKSLQRRILERLVADGHIQGNISGAPD